MSRQRVTSGLTHVMLIFWSAVVIVPMAWTVLSSFKTSAEIFASPFTLPEHPQWTNYVTAWATSQIGQFFVNTVITSAAGTIGILLCGSMVAYVVVRFDNVATRILHYAFLSGMVFPAYLAIVPLFFVMQAIGLLGSLSGLIVAYIAFSLAGTVFLLTSFFRAIPGELAEAAEVDGANEWRIFGSIMLPMVRGGLSAIGIFTFIGLWNQFLLPTVLLSDPKNHVLSQGLIAFTAQAGYSVDYGAMFAAMVITMAPILAVYLIFQRHIVASVNVGAVK
ncbi:carbohydrate ABC transporter permease [Kribbella sp. GL6]|uniref:carbohydrate ABC transporter permease n=1 Tax=Kribbella sp. GL6 TaxID=3419765 RepID=UPI003D0536DB